LRRSIGAADSAATGICTIVDKMTVEHPGTAVAEKNGAATFVVCGFAGGVAIDEGDILNDGRVDHAFTPENPGLIVAINDNVFGAVSGSGHGDGMTHLKVGFIIMARGDLNKIAFIGSE